MLKEDQKRFLIDRCGANKVKHSGRSLLEHLCGTSFQLWIWGNSQAVCDAGLFHSIYGTSKFRHKSWPLSDRETIRNLIGLEAEHLAYLFCTMDRKKFFEDSEEPGIMRRLREIEAANLIDQRSRSRTLEKLLDSIISGRAKKAINKYLDGIR